MEPVGLKVRCAVAGLAALLVLGGRPALAAYICPGPHLADALAPGPGLDDDYPKLRAWIPAGSICHTQGEDACEFADRYGYRNMVSGVGWDENGKRAPRWLFRRDGARVRNSALPLGLAWTDSLDQARRKLTGRGLVVTVYRQPTYTVLNADVCMPSGGGEPFGTSLTFDRAGRFSEISQSYPYP